MSEFPTEDEEFELMYGDEYDLIKQQEDFDDEPPQVVRSRRSLDFNTPSTSKQCQKENTNPNVSQVSLEDIEDIDNGPLIINPTPKDQTIGEIEAISASKEQSLPSGSNKRRIEDVFGDIDDIMFEEQMKKKKKNPEEEEQELIDEILYLRRINKKESEQILNSKDYTNYSKERDRRNISYTVPNYSFIGITRYDRERIYIRFHSEKFEVEETQRMLEESNKGSILGANSKKIWEGARKLLEEKEQATEEIIVQAPTVHKEDSLWVDLFKPKKYLELLSEESINRAMLKWIKLWDKIVFNRRPKVKPQPAAEPAKHKFFKNNNPIMTLDETGRPNQKVALLCGPPGLGKTTLAHMVAKHAGYNVYEINASDDRSLDAFKTALENATQMRSLVDLDKRPNCVVFDEIDGAPSASIDFLVKFIQGTAPVKGKKGAKDKKQSLLRRPIICICNDAYAPALRPLKQIAYIVNFPHTSSVRLAERLMEISKKQSLPTNLTAMLALAEKSQNDIRSCLSVLQFYKAQNKPVNLSDVYKSSVGQKDMQKGLFAVWDDIFRIKKPKILPGQEDAQREFNLGTRMEKIVQTVSSFGDYERLIQGVFENYPTLKFKDHNLRGTSITQDWFTFTDLLIKQIQSQQNYSLATYLPYGFVQWHFVFSTFGAPKLTYPSQSYEAKVKSDRTKSLVQGMLKGMVPQVKAFCQKKALILDILPTMARIILPPLRPVNFQLFTPAEKVHLERVTAIMADYNLNYIQERNAEGNYVYNLDPDINELVIFDKEDSNIRQLPYSNRQLISQSIEKYKMMRFEKSYKQTKEKTNNLPNHLQTLQIKKIKTKTSPGVQKDFFGRVMKQYSSSNDSSAQTICDNDIWYQYKEGHNNAVKKGIKISTLL